MSKQRARALSTEYLSTKTLKKITCSSRAKLLPKLKSIAIRRERERERGQIKIVIVIYPEKLFHSLKKKGVKGRAIKDKKPFI